MVWFELEDTTPKIMLKPKLFTALKDYSREKFVSDLIAGVIVGIVALPLAIAFAIASGVSPEKGLVTAIVAGFIISALGGSRVQIGGPTGAFIVIVYGIVQKHGVDGLIIATILAGLILIVMGFARFGTAIKFVPHSVIVGFTSGIALIIFSSQIKDLFGLSLEKVPGEFLEKWKLYFEHSGSFRWEATAVSLGTITLILVWNKFFKRIPGALVAILFFSAAAQIFQLPVETIASRFGELPRSFPVPHLPAVDLEMISRLIQPAFTIALLAAIESLLSAVVADGMIGSRHRSNIELVAQGIANVFSGLFGGIPATGAIARTATNIKNGGRTPIAGIIHAVTLLLILLFFGQWAKLIPLACLAGILVIVAYHMSEWRSFLALLKGPRSDAVVMILTFLLTVFVDLTVAIEVGMVLSAFLFMHRMSTVTEFKMISSVAKFDEGGRGEKESLEETSRLRVPEGVEVFEINGPLFFGVSHEFEETMRIIEKSPKVRILRLRHVPVIDATGLQSLKQFHKKCRIYRVRLILSGARPQLVRAMRSSGLYEEIGGENIVGSIEEALERSRKIMSAEALSVK